MPHNLTDAAPTKFKNNLGVTDRDGELVEMTVVEEADLLKALKWVGWR